MIAWLAAVLLGDRVERLLIGYDIGARHGPHAATGDPGSVEGEMITDLVEAILLAAIARQWHFAHGDEAKRFAAVGGWCLARRFYVMAPMIEQLAKASR